MKFRQGDAPAILYSRNGVKLYEFDKDRFIETDDEDLINLLLAMGAVEIPPYVPPVPQDLTEVGERINALSGRVTVVEGRADIRSVGAGLSLSGAGKLSATGSGSGSGSGTGGDVTWADIKNKPDNLATTEDVDAKVFIAEYNVTTVQQIIAYLDSAKEPFAPILIKRGNDYYTCTTASKQADNKVIIRSFATLSGNFFMFTYTVTNGSWSSSSYGFQQLLESGTNIKTVGGQSILGSGNIPISGGGGQDNVIESISVNGIAQAVDANKNVDLLVPTYSKNTGAFAAYDEGAEFNLQPSTNGMTASWAEGTTVVSSELTSKTYVDANASALAARVTANEAAIADRYTKAETDQKIAEGIATVDSEHFHPVTVLPDPQDADPTKRPKENHEYVLVEYEQDGTTIKSETHYLFYDGVYHQKPTVSLDGYATEQYVDDGLDQKASLNIATIPGGGGGDEISATVSQGTGSVNVNYYKDSELPNSLNLNVGEDAFRIPTTGYVDDAVTDKTLAPSGWGVVRTGVATVTFNNSKWSSSASVDVSKLGFSSGADYEVVAQPTTGGTATPWGNAVAFVNADKGASSFSVSAVTMEESLSGTVNVKYTIFAKGYGGTHFVDGTGLPTGGVMGQVLAKRSDTDGDVLWKNANTDNTSVNKANLQGRMVGVYTDDIGGDTTKRFMVMNDSTNKEVAVSFRNAEAELNETAQLYHKDAVDEMVGDLTALTTAAKTDAVAAINEVNGKVGAHLVVGVERWHGTYTDETGVTYQVYSKIIKIDALPATAGITNYPHGITGIKQILSAYGFTTDGFVLNAPRQNAQDNIAIYQVSKSNTTGSIAIEVGKDRSSKQAYVCLVYAKDN